MSTLYKLLNNIVIDYPELIERLYAKMNSRHKQLFYSPNISTEYTSFSPSNISMSVGNSMNNVDLFHSSLNDISSHVY